MPKLTIDGREVEVPAGTSILEAARTIGVVVPHYCYHPRLRVDGNCRICLVDVKGAPKPPIACGTPVADGMVVETQSPLATKARAGVMEFLLVNHPLDCPICDQAGECKLQDFAHQYGSGESRFGEAKVAKPKKVVWSDTILFDAERCILCTRCIRFFQDVRGRDLVGIHHMGDRSTLAPGPPGVVEDPYSMNIIDLCPVGALTSRDFRFRSRIWFMKFEASVCGHCARGCAITIGSRDDRILRFAPRENPLVNHEWMCDDGRLSYGALQTGDRVPHPAVRENGRLRAAAADEAVLRAAEALRAASGSAGSVAAIVSTRATSEELFLAGRILEVLGSTRADAAAPEVTGPSDPFLRLADATPNTAGAIRLGVRARDGGRGVDSILSRLGSGVRGLLVLGAGPDVAWSRVPDGGLGRLEALVAIDARPSPASEAATAAFPGRTYVEKRGTFVNAQGCLQRVRPAVAPPQPGIEEWDVLNRILRALDPTAAFDSFDAVVRSTAGALGAPAGVAWKTLGPHGVLLDGAALPGVPATPPKPTPMSRQGLPLDLPAGLPQAVPARDGA